MFLLASGRHICAPRETQTWRLHTKPYKFEKNIPSNISRTKHRTDLNLCETVWIFIFFYLFDSWLYLLNGFDDGVKVKTGNFLPWEYLLPTMLFNSICIAWNIPSHASQQRFSLVLKCFKWQSIYKPYQKGFSYIFSCKTQREKPTFRCRHDAIVKVNSWQD